MSVSGSYNPQTGTGSDSLGTTQPTIPGLWIDNGVLTFWNGATNSVLDFDEGTRSSVFGTPLGDV